MEGHHESRLESVTAYGFEERLGLLGGEGIISFFFGLGAFTELAGLRVMSPSATASFRAFESVVWM